MSTLAKPVVDHSIVPQDQIDQYQDEGYMILEGVIPSDLLDMLREECAYFMGYNDAEMDAKKSDIDGISIRRNRYFIHNRYHTSPNLWKFLYSDLMGEVAKATVGNDAYLFHEQWVVKAAEKGGAFSWHQDSGYVNSKGHQAGNTPYVTCWCTLDDVSEDNGTVYLLPHSRGGTKSGVIEHVKDEKNNDMVGYHGDDPGIPIEVPAGSIVAFTSWNFHRSGPNTTPNARRIYLPQYSAEPILNEDGDLWAQAVPFLKDGQNVYDYAADMATPRDFRALIKSSSR